MAPRTFKSVSFVAEHVPETHRTLENDLTVTEQELPGTVDVYVVIDGGRVLFTQLSGSKVLEAIERDQADQPTQASQEPDGPQAAGTAPPATATAPADETPAPETPQA